ncbi:superoxide dismutase [Allorhodopirellula solitaria]|uniref:Superoxide dismutase n=1 Tax=Allorhodopirellula solitaria TaxID=2527987 RepID=A0A5C5XYZ4_9BACT|nr:superoxide dismutase [Allorhodopirellula solitaria]TWT67503.1 Superoxide dismutase [Fe] [Allorhodopirellula solitaria]
MPAFQQPPLPYAMDALKGYISEEQMSYHYEKHHASYFTKLNKILEDDPLSEESLEDVVIASSGGTFNNAAQAWNHAFFWNCMTPSASQGPSGPLADLIDRDFRDFDSFKRQFSAAATTLFGAGWAWLAIDPTGKLSILPLGNADTPLKHNQTPLLTLDVWEHAYYVDYRNERPKFVDGFWDVTNWDFVAERLAGAVA